MKFFYFLFIALMGWSACGSETGNTPKLSENIRINQLGYFTSGPKVFVVADLQATSFEVLDTANNVVFEDQLAQKGTWDKSGEVIAIGDFSKLTREGNFVIRLETGEVSYPFAIGNDIYSELSKAAVKSYYLHRISMPIEEQYAGIYHRPVGHKDIKIPFHLSTGKISGFLDTPGGWYDAGDYGKYIINAGVSVGMMLAMHEQYPDAYPDGSLHTTESGNGVSDLLDELRYEIEWMLTMQDDDGGVFVKVTTFEFGGMVMPEVDTAQRYVIGKSTAAALHLAAVGAMAARAYATSDDAFAQKCQQAAIKAWQWAVQNPEVYYDKNPDDVKTGAYNDVILDEEFFWAAAELYITTEASEYFENIQLKLGDIAFRLEENWRNYVDNIGYYSLLGPASPLTTEQKKLVADGLLHLAQQLAEKHRSIPYQIPVDHFVWGSNSDVLDAAMIFANAYEVSKDQMYMDMAVESFDYIMGKNATAYSFVTGFGEKSPMHIHHRPSEADGIVAPYPGFVVGGPNVHMQDKVFVESNGQSYPSALPAKAYIDAVPSFASNEVCINWNAPAVYMLGFFDHHFH
ncbi:MAG: cellulase [Cyclobacteriaceae bacterium]|nr:cellulase [Cyclobacteriaceae bacterium]